jgi:galactokinase
MQQETGPEIAFNEFIRVFGPRGQDWPRVYQAPGRINLIGEHTDYNGGFVLPSTIDLYTWVAISPRDDRLLQVYDCHGSRLHSLNLDCVERGTRGEPQEYLKSVAWALEKEGLQLRGTDVIVTGNIPQGGGLSSSASLELTLALALLETSGYAMDRKRLALLCQRAEVEFVGAQCGIMDQFVVALGAPGRALKLNCRTLDYQLLAIPPELQFLVVHSGVSHRVSTGSYNSRREECDAALKILQAAAPGLEYLSGLKESVLEENRNMLGDVAYRRVRHVVTENQRVLDAEDALRNSDLESLGALVDQSHISLRDDFEVSCPELDRLVEIATACEGVLGSRMMGGGFGGCTISLVRKHAAQLAAREIGAQFAADNGQAPWMHVAGPATAAQRVR